MQSLKQPDVILKYVYERVTEEKTVKLGDYGFGRMVDGQAQTYFQPAIVDVIEKQITKDHQWDFFFKPQLKNSDFIVDASRLGIYYMLGNIVGQDDINFLNHEFTLDDRPRYAYPFAMITQFYNVAGLSASWIYKKYPLGLFLSDFIDILPAPIAAKILLSSGDPEMTPHLIKHFGIHENINVQDSAVEAFVLLSSEKKEQVIHEMASLAPDQGRVMGSARKFLNFVSADAQLGHRSKLYRFLDQNLDHEWNTERPKSVEKLAEVIEQLPQLAEIIKSYSN